MLALTMTNPGRRIRHLTLILAAWAVACSGQADPEDDSRIPGLTGDEWSVTLGEDQYQAVGSRNVLTHPSGDVIVVGVDGQVEEQEPGIVPRVYNSQLQLARFSRGDESRQFEVTSAAVAEYSRVLLSAEGDILILTDQTVQPMVIGGGDGDGDGSGAIALSHLVKFSGESGQLLWDVELPTESPTVALTGSGDLLVATRHQYGIGPDFALLSVASGEEIWRTADSGENTPNWIAVGSNDDFFVSWDVSGRMTGISRHSLVDGSELWRQEAIEQGESGKIFALPNGNALADVGNTESEYRTSVNHQSYAYSNGSEVFAELSEYYHGEYSQLSSPRMGMTENYFTFGMLEGGLFFTERSEDTGETVWTSPVVPAEGYVEPLDFSLGADGEQLIGTYRDESGYVLAWLDVAATDVTTVQLAGTAVLDFAPADGGAYFLLAIPTDPDDYYSRDSDRQLVFLETAQ